MWHTLHFGFFPKTTIDAFFSHLLAMDTPKHLCTKPGADGWIVDRNYDSQ